MNRSGRAKVLTLFEMSVKFLSASPRYNLMQLRDRRVYCRGKAGIQYGGSSNVARELSTWNNVSQVKDSTLFPVIRDYYGRCEI